jgi:hypothetical protein
VINGIFVLVLIICERKIGEHKCGIDVLFWLIVLCLGLIARACLEFTCYFLLMCKTGAKCMLNWYITENVIGYLFIAVWLIFGYALYFSEANDC